jgi:hypothetical protein
MGKNHNHYFLSFTLTYTLINYILLEKICYKLEVKDIMHDWRIHVLAITNFTTFCAYMAEE